MPQDDEEEDLDHEFLFDLEAGESVPECPQCSGPGQPLGQLGNRKHYRCRNCGADFSKE